MTPEGWSEMPLGDVASFIGSGVTPRGGSSVYVPNGVPFLRSQNVHFGGLVLDDVAFVTAELHADMKRTHVQPLDVLLNITGASIGRCTYVPEDFGRANVNQHVCIVRCEKGKADPRYIAHYLSSPRGQDEIRSRQAGLSREALNYEQVRALRVLKPPLPEQRKIAAILSSVDDAIDKTQAVIDQLAVVKKAMMQELLTKGLPGRHTRFKQTEIGMVPEGWEVVPLEAAAAVFNGRASGTGGTWLRVFKTKHVYDGMLRLSCPEYAQDLSAAKVPVDRYLEAEDVLTPNMAHGTIGRVAYVPGAGEKWTVDGQVMVLRADRKRLYGRFLYEVMSSVSGRQSLLDLEKGGAFDTLRGQTHIYPADVREIHVPLPPLDEQKTIAGIAAGFDEPLSINELRTSELRILKNALMSVLLTGEVRVTPDGDTA